VSRFLFTVWGFRTHLDPFFAVAKALVEQGHEVAIYSATGCKEEAESIGCRFFPFRDLDQSRADELVGGILANRRRPWRQHSFWTGFLLDSIPAQIRDVEELLDEWAPDVILCDMALWGPILVIPERRGIPVAVLSHVGFAMLPGPHGPIPGVSLGPPDGWATRLAARVAGAAVQAATAGIPRRIARVRESFGLAPSGMRMVDYYARMPLMLIPATREFDYGREDLPESVQYVGPCLWEPPDGISQAPPEGEFRSGVLVEEGSLYAAEPFLPRVAAKALSGLSMPVTVLAGRGRDFAPLRREVQGRNVRVECWRHLGGIAGGAELVVTSGNTESVLSALSQGTPVVVVSAILDQSEIGWRVQASGAGLRLPETRCTPGRLREAVERVLRESSYRTRAARLADEFSRNPGSRRASELLAGLAMQQSGRRN
jgi:MGT family glycosyltransferase